jgi:hypothetical protein
MRTDECNSAGDDTVKSRLPGMKQDHQLSRELTFSVSGECLELVGAPKMCLRNVRDFMWLRAYTAPELTNNIRRTLGSLQTQARAACHRGWMRVAERAAR